MSARDFVILAAMCVLWAVNNIVSKYVVSTLDVPPLFYAAARFLVVALCTLPFLLPAPKPIWRIVAVATFIGGGSFALMFMGLKEATPSSSSVVLLLGMPITTLLSVWFLGERIRWRRALGIALAFAGVLTVMWDPHGFRISRGLLLVAASTVSGALGAVLMKQMEGVKPSTYQAWVGLVSFVPLAALSALSEPDSIAKASAAGPPFIAAVAFSALIVSLVAHTLYYQLMQKYEANLISALCLMTPLMTIGLGVALLGDPFGPRLAVGSALTLAGVLIIALRGNQAMAMLLAARNRVQ